MPRSRSLLLPLACVVVPLASPAGAQNARTPPSSAALFSNLGLRSIGPALTSGRVVAFAVNPNDPTHYFAAAGSGGVWKTTNSGVTWTPVFENEASYSIGAVALDPKNPDVVWVGTGEMNAQRSVGWGDGVYKSEDGGRSWRNVGLKTSEHIGRIVIDPNDTNTVYVAAQGPLWREGGERGLYKTTDGGKTWKKVLNVSDNTGISDVVLDPKDPVVIYAAAWQRRRHVFTYIGGGPESGIYKSTDGGATWQKAQRGIPGGDLGRIGLAFSPANPDYLYATVEAGEGAGGVFRTTNGGASWEKRGSAQAQGMYYGQIVPDPKNPERVYLPDVQMQVSDDGGRTFRPVGERNKHVDNHTIWINPANTRHLLVGCDGGIYESFDSGATWDYKENLPITQFYRVAVDNAKPFYNIYGGTQDNNSLGGPSRTKDPTGPTNNDWFVTLGGDGFHQQVDPTDPNIVYSVLQYGVISRLNRATGERVGIQPVEGKGEPALRWNWDSPLLISPHKNTRLYFAANRLYRSEDRGDNWKPVGPDLTRQIDRNRLTIMGKVQKVDAIAKGQSTSFYGNIVSLDESPKKEGVLYVGTDDGLIQVSENGGAAWRKEETFPGVPAMTYVSYLHASRHDANTVYAAFDNHKYGDFAPYLMKSTDMGRTWTPIVGDLPKNGPVLCVREDPTVPGLLFVGTEFGAYFTLDGGAKWQKLGGLPTIAVRDIAIQAREGDLVLATFGRGFYVLDDYTPLRQAAQLAQSQAAHLFPVRGALAYAQYSRLGGGKGDQGETFFSASNPPYGATITYYLKEGVKSLRQKRLEAEAEAEKKKETPPYPTAAQLRAESEEEPPVALLTVTDEAGNVVRRLTGPASPGMFRVTWDLNGPPISAGFRGFGFPVFPGTYKVALARRANGTVTELAGPVAFTVTGDGDANLSASDKKALTEARGKVARLQTAVQASSQTINDLLTRMGVIKAAIQDAPGASLKLRETATGIEKRLRDLNVALNGNPQAGERTQPEPPSVADRVRSVTFAMIGQRGKPTGTTLESYRVAASEFGDILAKLKTIAQDDLPRLEKELDRAGVPLTPGRLPDWKD